MNLQINRSFATVLVALGVSAGAKAAADACQGYNDLGDTETKEYRDKLIEENADPLDRLFAFEKLVCSNKPTIRSYAIREGLKAARDPLVRHQVMFEALMQKVRIDVELSDKGNLTEEEREFVRDIDGIYSRDVRFRDRSAGCISFYSPTNCDPSRGIVIQGDKVTYSYGTMTGLFELTEYDELVGYIKPDDDSRKIPAVIKLF